MSQAGSSLNHTVRAITASCESHISERSSENMWMERHVIVLQQKQVFQHEFPSAVEVKYKFPYSYQHSLSYLPGKGPAGNLTGAVAERQWVCGFVHLFLTPDSQLVGLCLAKEIPFAMIHYTGKTKLTDYFLGKSNSNEPQPQFCNCRRARQNMML